MPAGLDNLSYDEPLLLKCAAPQAASSHSNQLTLPAARRTDPGFEPRGYAVIYGELREILIKIQANITTLDPVADVACYQVYYYPEIMVFSESLQSQVNLSGSEFVWSLICEEA